MTGFQSGSAIDMLTAETAITIVGNGAVFDAAGKDNCTYKCLRRLFYVGPAVALMMSNVTLQNAVCESSPCTQ
jgi:hypothetical protein